MPVSLVLCFEVLAEASSISEQTTSHHLLGKTRRDRPDHRLIEICSAADKRRCGRPQARADAAKVHAAIAEKALLFIVRNSN